MTRVKIQFRKLCHQMVYLLSWPQGSNYESIIELPRVISAAGLFASHLHLFHVIGGRVFACVEINMWFSG